MIEGQKYYYMYFDKKEIGGITKRVSFTDESCKYEIRQLREMFSIEIESYLKENSRLIIINHKKDIK